MNGHFLDGSNYECVKCLTVTIHDMENLSNSYDQNSDFNTEHLLKTCRGCGEKSFLIISYDNSNYEEYSEISYPSTQEIAYQKLIKQYNIENFQEASKSLFHQVLNAYSNNLLLLATVGLRVLIEELVNHLNIDESNDLFNSEGEKINNFDELINFEYEIKPEIESGRNDLMRRLNTLYKLGYVNRLQLFALHKVRDYGNKAAHESKAISEPLFELMLDSIYQVYYLVYVLPEKLEMQEFTDMFN